MSRRVDVAWNNWFQEKVLNPYIEQNPGKDMFDYISAATQLKAYWDDSVNHGAKFSVLEKNGVRRGVVLGFHLNIVPSINTSDQ